jgi:DNA repair ATPase RecN
MTLKELLKKHGLDDDVISQVLEEMKANKIFTASEENMDVRYPKLKADFDALTAQHTEAQTLIDNLKKGSRDNESMQAQIADYQNTVQKLQAELEEERRDNALKFALVSAGANADDVDYLIFTVKRNGDELKLDANGQIKGIDNIIRDVKTAKPNMFAAGEGKSSKRFEPNPLPDGQDKTVTREQFQKMDYSQRLNLKNTNPEAYKKLTGH